MKYRFVMTIGLLGCAGHGGDRNVAEPARNDSPAKEGGTCVPAGAIVDERFNPVDMNRQASVMSAAGKPVFFCAPVVQARSGVVVDETTRAPVAGAVVTIEAWHARPPIGGIAPNRQLLKVVDVRADAQGRWNAPESTIWLPGILAADGLPYVVRSYCVHADGHAPFVLDPWKPHTGATDDSVSEIGLRAAAERDTKPGREVSTCGIPLGPPL